MKKILLVLFSLLTLNILSFADNISISGIDTSSMMFSGKISLYLHITDDLGLSLKDVKPEDLKILESVDDDFFDSRVIKKFQEGINEVEGINIKLLIDNSGSMYETLDGKETENYEKTRINLSINAIKTLINAMKGSRDKAGISIFNTYYNELVPISSNRNLVLDSLQMIEKPGKDESFTELNAALFHSAAEISRNRGRKIIIVLSDGENYPFSIVRKSDSPQFASKLYKTKEIIDELKLNSATLYGINFGTKRDRELEKIVIETGGYLYEANSEDELTQVYQNIRNRVLSEYYLEYVTDTIYSEEKQVKAQLISGAIESGKVSYFSGNLFGNPSQNFLWLAFITLPIALILFLLLAFQKLSNPADKAGLEIQDLSGATQIFELKDNKTVIGNSSNDDITLVTEKEEEDDDEKNNATIIFDEKKSQYTVVSDKEVFVNNNPVKTRVLEPGDVLSIDGATIVFNDKEKI